MIGRFINSDSVVSGIGGNVLGYNLFAYCLNNPMNMVDQCGNLPKFMKNAIKWVAHNIARPVVKKIQKDLENQLRRNPVEVPIK
jgi:hypothetical protein